MNKWTIGFTNLWNGYYIHSDKGYLHTNGEIYSGITNHEGVYTGLYKDKCYAKKVLDKYQPKVLLKDVKIGQSFYFADEENAIIHKKFNGSSLLPKFNYEKVTFIIDVHHEPNEFRWLNEGYYEKEVILVN